MYSIYERGKGKDERLTPSLGHSPLTVDHSSQTVNLCPFTVHLLTIMLPKKFVHNLFALGSGATAEVIQHKIVKEF